MLHLIIINYDYNATCATANAWLDQAASLTSWVEHLQAAGLQVTVFQRFPQDQVLKRNNVTYHLVSDTFAAKLRAWQIPRTIHWSVRVLCRAHVQVGHATLVQVNGLCFPLQIRYLRSLLPSACPIIGQNQGEQPWSAPWSLLQRWGIRHMAGFLFAEQKLAQPWLQQSIIRSPQLVHELPAHVPDLRTVAAYETILQECTV